jgi:hypothetical protein
VCGCGVCVSVCVLLCNEGLDDLFDLRSAYWAGSLCAQNRSAPITGADMTARKEQRVFGLVHANEARVVCLCRFHIFGGRVCSPGCRSITVCCPGCRGICGLLCMCALLEVGCVPANHDHTGSFVADQYPTSTLACSCIIL